ncbi:MAG TPA: GNAT family N-acetyltransferase, partial [Herpetosiphonaceae bacterium]
FGFFEVLDDPEAAAALLAAAAEWVRLRGGQALRGPMNFSINDECGLLVEGFDAPPVAMMTYNPPRYVEHIEQAGFRKLIDLYAWLLEAGDGPPPARLERVAALARRRAGLTFRRLDMGDFDAEVSRGWELYNRAWADNWGAVPMTREEFDYLARSFKPFLDPELLVLAEAGGELAGLLIAVPDLNIPLRRMDGTLLPTGWATFLWHRRKIDTLRVMIMGVLPQHRRRGIDAVLYQEALAAARRGGYRRAELSWILETNAVMNNTLRALGARCYKTYRIYELPLAGGRD